MKDLVGLLTGLSILSVFFVFLSIVAGRISYKGRNQKQYSFRNTFPFEFNYNAKFIDNFYSNSLINLSVLLSGLFYIFFLTKVHNDGVLLSLGIFGLISSICLGFLYFVPLKLIKPHLLLDAIFFMANIIVASLIAIGGYKIRQEGGALDFLIFFYIGLALTAANLIVIFNPKLSTKLMAIKKGDENGQEYYERPRYIVLAFSEWLMLFSFYINLIVTLCLYISFVK